MTDSQGPEAEEALAGSNAEVVSTLVENHRRFLAFLERRLGDRGQAEELLQAAFVRGIERSGTLRANESAVAWFFRLLRNALVDHHRRAQNRVRAASDFDPENEPAEPAPETKAEICRCILGLADTLKPEYALALKSVEVEGRSVQDFAVEAGISANNASVRLFRAREALRKRVSATCGTCADHGCLDCSCGSKRTCG